MQLQSWKLQIWELSRLRSLTTSAQRVSRTTSLFRMLQWSLLLESSLEGKKCKKQPGWWWVHSRTWERFTKTDWGLCWSTISTDVFRKGAVAVIFQISNHSWTRHSFTSLLLNDPRSVNFVFHFEIKVWKNCGEGYNPVVWWFGGSCLQWLLLCVLPNPKSVKHLTRKL